MNYLSVNTTKTKHYTKIFKFFIKIPLHVHTNTPRQQTPQFKNPKKKLTKLIANDYKIVSLSFDFILEYDKTYILQFTHGTRDQNTVTILSTFQNVFIKRCFSDRIFVITAKYFNFQWWHTIEAWRWIINNHIIASWEKVIIN